MKVERQDVLPELERPKDLSQVLYQEHIVNDFANYIKNKDFPDMIISGPAGTGKTTLALILAYAVCGQNNTKVLDASQDNGINVMRGLTEFMETYGGISENLKCIIFDEADNITFQAQQALRRPIEKYSKYCKVIFVCNYIRKIIEPLQSRCKAKYEAKKIPDNIIKNRLVEVVKKYKISIPLNGTLEKLVKKCDGDMRGCLVILDAVRKGASIENFISVDDNKQFISLCMNGKYNDLRNFLNEKISDEGQLRQIIKASMDVVVDSKNLDTEMKHEVLKLLGEAEYRLTMSSNHYAVAFWLAASIQVIRQTGE